MLFFSFACLSHLKQYRQVVIHWERTHHLGEAPIPVLYNVLNVFLLLCWSLLLHSLRNIDQKKKKLEPNCKGRFIPYQEISIIFEIESKRKGKKVAF